MRKNRLNIILIISLGLLWLLFSQGQALSQGVYTLSVDSEAGGGMVTKDPAKVYYEDGETVVLRAQPDHGYTFSHWSGDISGSDNPAPITMDGDKSVIAHFEDSGLCTLSVMFTHSSGDPEADPPIPPEAPYGSVSVSPYSKQYGDAHEQKYDYEPGTEVELTATGGRAYMLWYWSGDIYSHDNPVTVTLNSDMRITPVWKIDQTKIVAWITVTDGKAKITILGRADWGDAAIVSWGETLPIKANDPPDDHHFTHWSGPTEDDTKNIADIYTSFTTITMYNDAHIFANFEEDSEGDYFNLALSAVHGTVARDPMLAEYEKGTEVTLTATPAPGYDFRRWEGDLIGNENPTTIIMNEDKSITAVFATPEYSLDLIASHGTITKDPDKELYHDGDVVQLTAEPYEGYVFARWEGDVTGEDNPTMITVEGEEKVKTVTAIFEEGEYEYTLEVTAEHGTVIKIPDESGYEEDQRVDLIAQSDWDYSFVRWEGDVTGQDNPTHIIMEGENKNKVVTAVFEESGTLSDFTLAISAEHGHVDRIPDQDIYGSGTPVSIVAVSDEGYSFAGWSGDLSGNDNPGAILMDSHKYITAHFSAISVILGDVTGNGEISSYDASLTAQYSIGLIDFTSEQRYAADVTGNGEVSSYDASLIAQYAIALIEGF